MNGNICETTPFPTNNANPVEEIHCVLICGEEASTNYFQDKHNCFVKNIKIKELFKKG